MASNKNQNVTYGNKNDITAKSKTITTTNDVNSIKTLSSQFRQYVATKCII